MMIPTKTPHSGLARRVTFISALLAASAMAVSTIVPTTAWAEGGNRPRAERLLDELKQHGQDPEVARLTARAKDALERAAVTPAADVSAALEAAALEWARAASTWVELRRAEAAATEREQALDELRSRLKHARAQLEETEARRSRAAGLLERMKAAGEQETAPSTSTQPAAKQPPAAAEAAPARKRQTPASGSSRTRPKAPAPPPEAPTAKDAVPKDPAPSPQQVKP